MQNWQTTYLGLKDLPRELSTLELQAFFTYSKAEREVIDARYGAPHKLGLALHMGVVVRMLGGGLIGSSALIKTFDQPHAQQTQRQVPPPDSEDEVFGAQLG